MDAERQSVTHSSIPGAREFTRQEKFFTIFGTLLGLLLAALDQTIVATAGPLIQRDLEIAPSLYAWITTAYLVASTVLLPIYGKLSDTFGRRRVLLVGMTIFLVGSACCGVAQNAIQLILARAVQGVGSAALFTTAFAVVADLFAPAERGKYQGIFGSAFGLASVVGPLAGGYISDNLGWHWAFFINLPIGAIAMTFIVTRMPALNPRVRSDAALDVRGALALIVGVVPILVAVTLARGGEAAAGSGLAWTSWQILTLFAVGVCGLLAFLWIEQRAQAPILELSLFRNRVFAVGNAATFVAGTGFLAAIVFLPLFMVNVVGVSATHAGLTTTPLTLGVVAGNIGSGQLVARTGRYKPIILTALAVLAVAFTIMGFTLSAGSTQRELTLKMVLVGLGLGPTIPLYTLAIQNAVPPTSIGVATSMATFSRSMGSTIGIALIGTVFAGTLAAAMESRVNEAVAGVPSELRAQIGRATGVEGLGTNHDAPHLGFDVGRARQSLDAHFRERQRLLMGTSETAADAAPASTRSALNELQREHAVGLKALDAIASAMKAAVTDAIRRIYQLCIGVACLALLISAALPELPLRRRQSMPAPPPD